MDADPPSHGGQNSTPNHIEELAFLETATGIGQAQGYYFSKPVPLESIISTRTIHHGVRSPIQARIAPPRRAAQRGTAFR